MRKNSIRKGTLHSAMGSGALAESRGWKRTVLIVIGVVTLLAMATGLCIGYSTLRGLYQDQFVLTDLETQVTINVPKAREHLDETRPPLSPETVVALFGLKNGVNLAHVDFNELRTRILAEQHALRDITVRLQPTSRVVRAFAGLPRRENTLHVTISAEERDPVAILSHRGDRALRTVVDRDGVLFEKRFDPRRLPRIVERDTVRTKPGHRLSGRGLAALRLIDYCQQTATPGDGLASGEEVSIREVDVTSPDYLLAWLSNGHKAKFVWEGMDEQLPGSQKALARQVEHLRKALGTHIAESGITTCITWNATLPDRVFADTKEPIQ